jgi:hypothetical protein
MRFSSPHHRHALPSSPACQISSFISGGQIYFVMLFRVLKVVLVDGDAGWCGGRRYGSRDELLVTAPVQSGREWLDSGHGF